MNSNDRFPHQVAINMIWALYGFFWQVDPATYGGGIHFHNGVMTVQFFRDFHEYDASRIRYGRNIHTVYLCKMSAITELEREEYFNERNNDFSDD